VPVILPIEISLKNLSKSCALPRPENTQFADKCDPYHLKQKF
jgi:hypothetical protein